MIDAATKKTVRVLKVGDNRPHLYLPNSQLETVQRLFESHGIGYWVNEMSLSMDGGPYVTHIVLDRKADPVFVQTLLDSVN